MQSTDSSASPYADLEHELRELLRRAASHTGATARRVHPDLEASAYPLLATIAMNPGLRATDLAEHFGLGAPTVSRQVSRLVDLGLVTRQTDPDDSRVHLLGLTDNGTARLQAARDARIEIVKEVVASWHPRDVSRLATLLHRYADDVAAWAATHSASGEPGHDDAD